MMLILKVFLCIILVEAVILTALIIYTIVKDEIIKK